MGDRQRARVVRRCRKRGRVLEAAEEVRLLEEHARRHRPQQPRELVGSITPPRCGTSTTSKPKPRRVGLARPGAPAGSVSPRARPCGGRLHASRRSTRRRRPCSRRSPTRSTPPSRQLADHGLELEDRLQRALAHLRLVRRVRGQELAAREHDVGDGGHVVVVDARRRRTTAPRRCATFFAASSSRWRASSARRARAATSSSRPKRTPGRDLLEELVDRRDADRGQHLRAVLVGQARGTAAAAHCVVHVRAVGVPSISPSSSPGSDMADPDQPALAVRIVVDELGRVDDRRVHLERPRRRAAR